MVSPDESARRRKHNPSLTSRERPGDIRDTAADELDAQATSGDMAAIERDAAALARDDVSIALEMDDDGVDATAAQARYWALRDRLGAASDRLFAANMRSHAQTDRSNSAEDRHDTSIDELTGSYRRDSGLIEIARDLGAARRTGQSMVLGFLDVDGIKQINDRRGHAAGDSVLQAVSMTLRSMLREYDLTVRYGGDEFLFSIVGATEEDARTRIEAVNVHLLAAGYNSVTCGLVTIGENETLTAAIDRADKLLYEGRTSKDHE
ncbi:GGDEF domain-containing protein [Antrihabitans spumae]|uniref:GGDEF domain-containing protein n=1 Tax=Antrihabitans spumae TaxID=3373370 RepID=A0ABW7K4A2_9NOCA